MDVTELTESLPHSSSKQYSKATPARQYPLQCTINKFRQESWVCICFPYIQTANGIRRKLTAAWFFGLYFSIAVSSEIL